MQKKNGGSVFWPRFPVEDGESIDIHRAIENLLFHGVVLSLGVHTQGRGERGREGRRLTQRPRR
jgi:hypothetical protein